MKIKLLTLKKKHAYTSYRWRNNKKIWKYTKNKPTKKIVLYDEKKWIVTVLKRKNERRFAIYKITPRMKKYIGNIYFTGIANGKAEYHIFIGDENCWGQGCGFEATKKALGVAKTKIKLKTVFLFVHKKNLAAIKIYKRCGFKNTITRRTKKFKKMIIKL
jgi:RimJ/RimL family protein N-acetyltransferase